VQNNLSVHVVKDDRYIRERCLWRVGVLELETRPWGVRML